jgi:hypothetical protein
MTVRRFTSRFGNTLRAGFISTLMHSPIGLNVFFRFFVTRSLTYRKSLPAALLEAMPAFPSEPWCKQNFHQGSEAQPFRAQILPNLLVNYHIYLSREKYFISFLLLRKQSFPQSKRTSLSLPCLSFVYPSTVPRPFLQSFFDLRALSGGEMITIVMVLIF